jgi:hypothetical protein
MKTPHHFYHSLLALGFSLFSLAQVQAVVVVLADDAIAPNALSQRPFTNTIGGVFNGNTITSGVTKISDALTYEALPAGTAGGHNNGRFETTPDASDSVTYTFSSTVDLDGLLFWNYNEYWNGNLYNDRGIVSSDITINHDGGSFTLQDVAFTQTPGGTSNTQTSVAQQISFGSDFMGVTSVVFDDITSTSGAQTGWQEIAFTAVPEPSSSALLGLGGLALMLRRRR